MYNSYRKHSLDLASCGEEVSPIKEALGVLPKIGLNGEASPAVCDILFCGVASRLSPAGVMLEILLVIDMSLGLNDDDADFTLSAKIQPE